MEGYYACDVDGVVADRFWAYQIFWQGKLGLWSSEEMAAMNTYNDLFKNEKFRSWKKENPDLLARFYAESQESIQVLQDCTPMPGAQEALTPFTVSYYTIRKSPNMELQALMHTVTREWLSSNGFPGDVHFPRSFAEKLAFITLHSQKRPIVFFDDRWQDIIKAYGQLLAKYPDNKAIVNLKERMTLVAFGTECLPENLLTHGLQVVPLRNWQAIGDINGLLHPGVAETL